MKALNAALEAAKHKIGVPTVVSVPITLGDRCLAAIESRDAESVVALLRQQVAQGDSWSWNMEDVLGTSIERKVVALALKDKDPWFVRGASEDWRVFVYKGSLDTLKAVVARKEFPTDEWRSFYTDVIARRHGERAAQLLAQAYVKRNPKWSPEEVADEMVRALHQSHQYADRGLARIGIDIFGKRFVGPLVARAVQVADTAVDASLHWYSAAMKCDRKLALIGLKKGVANAFSSGAKGASVTASLARVQWALSMGANPEVGTDIDEGEYLRVGMISRVGFRLAVLVASAAPDKAAILRWLLKSAMWDLVKTRSRKDAEMAGHIVKDLWRQGVRIPPNELRQGDEGVQRFYETFEASLRPIAAQRESSKPKQARPK
jgi:hypothetical protein